jgi:hypothetical protein
MVEAWSEWNENSSNIELQTQMREGEPVPQFTNGTEQAGNLQPIY